MLETAQAFLAAGGRPAAEREVPVRGRGGDRQPAPARVRRAAHAGELAADLVISADGAHVAAGRAVAVASPPRAWSRWTSWSRAPAPTCTRAGTAARWPTRCTRSAQILASLHGPDGRSPSPGFYDGIPALTARAPPRDRRGAVRRGGVPAPSSGWPRRTASRATRTLERLWERPTLEVNGVRGGGKYTVIPHVAVGHVSCRLVPGQDPDRGHRGDRRPRAQRRPRRACGSRCAPTRRGCPPTRSPPGHPAIRGGDRRAAQRSTPARRCCWPASAGTLPAADAVRATCSGPRRCSSRSRPPTRSCTRPTSSCASAGCARACGPGSSCGGCWPTGRTGSAPQSGGAGPMADAPD